MKNVNSNLYLSIDLDFWMRQSADVVFLDRVLRAVAAENRAAALHHDSILPHIRRYGRDCQHLVNLDAHSDFGGTMRVLHPEVCDTTVRRYEMHSGTWVNYVQWPRREKYTWAYPRTDSAIQGRTDHFTMYDCSFAEIPQHDRFTWLNVASYLAHPPNYGIDLERIRALSITLSPDFCAPDALRAFQHLVDVYNLELLDLLPNDLRSIRLVRPNGNVVRPIAHQCELRLTTGHARIRDRLG